jgi:hypothetical protein
MGKADLATRMSRFCNRRSGSFLGTSGLFGDVLKTRDRAVQASDLGLSK